METRSPLDAGIAWPIPWGGAWVGALAALAVGLIIGLLGYAFGAVDPDRARVFTWQELGFGAIVFGIAGAFFSFVVGGWVAARLAGIRRAESGMVLGGIVWVLAVPLLLAVAALGGSALWGGWYVGLGALSPAAADPATAEALQAGAVASAVALLLGLVGSVLGGWMASGEPMTLAGYRRRDIELEERPRRVA
jgi:hypothetical protein